MTAGSLILSIVVGPTFRSLAQFSYKQRGLWRLVVFVGILVPGLVLAIVGGAIGSLILGIPMGLLACFQMYHVMVIGEEARRWFFFTSLLTEGVKRWIFFTTLLIACLLFDLRAGYVLLSLDKISDFFYGPCDYSGGFIPRAGLTALIPTLWLFVL